MQLICICTWGSTVTMDDNSEQIVLEQFLPYRLNVIAEIVSQSLSRIYSSQYGITIPEWRVVPHW